MGSFCCHYCAQYVYPPFSSCRYGNRFRPRPLFDGLRMDKIRAHPTLSIRVVWMRYRVCSFSRHPFGGGLADFWGVTCGSGMSDRYWPYGSGALTRTVGMKGFCFLDRVSDYCFRYVHSRLAQIRTCGCASVLVMGFSFSSMPVLRPCDVGAVHCTSRRSGR